MWCLQLAYMLAFAGICLAGISHICEEPLGGNCPDVAITLPSSTLAEPHATASSLCSDATCSPSAVPYNSRAKWLPGFDVDTDYYTQVPYTGVTREYWLEITNATAAPDGRERYVLLVNGQLPGPTIEANWGDMVRVHVKNSLKDSGTSIHFHGIRQLNNNQMDGVPSLTQCPIPPGSTYTYEWRATQYGSSWYHSHFTLQAWNGVFGGIVIHGPATADYDEDLGSLFLNDWNPYSVNSQYMEVLGSIRTPQFDNGLLNGTNVWTLDNGTQIGKRFEAIMEPGKRYRLRLVNAAMHSLFKFSIDSHNLTVIGNDLVPIVPFVTDQVSINMGQRYDVIVHTNQLPTDYWIRANPQSNCSNNTHPDNVKGILRYNPVSLEDPTSSPTHGIDTETCADVDPGLLTPHLALPADLKAANLTNVFVTLDEFGEDHELLWTMNHQAFNNSWNNPLLQQLYNPRANLTKNAALMQVPTPGQWSIIVLFTPLPLPHPIHLHGHDFWVVGTGLGPFDESTAVLNFDNTPRRDVATMPAGGWVAIAFPADNPGVWLLHCHIGFHSMSGFAMQIIERQKEILPLTNKARLAKSCRSWRKFAHRDPDDSTQENTGVGAYDSGI